MQQIVTIPFSKEVYPCEKDNRYKFMIPIMSEKIGSVWYHTFRVTPHTMDELVEDYVYGDQSSDWD